MQQKIAKNRLVRLENEKFCIDKMKSFVLIKQTDVCKQKMKSFVLK